MATIIKENQTTRLDLFDNSNYQPGNKLKILLWYFINSLFFINPLFPISSFKVILLRLFGAKVGMGVVIKPRINIKYPWKLSIGNHVWIGEKVWIDNLDLISIEDHVCISQGAMLLCGNHDFSSPNFDLITKPICINKGSWIGAHAVVCPGVTVNSHAVLAVNSVATKNLEEYSIYQGNPAVLTKKRSIT